MTRNMLPVAQAVAAFLGDPWQAAIGRFGSGAADLTGPNHQRLELYELDNRWHARGLYPESQHSLPYDIKWSEITVAVHRGAQTLATEITRRLLPGYLAHLKEVLDFQSRCERQKQAQEQATDRILQVLPDARRLSFDPPRIIWYMPGPGYGRADIHLSHNASEIAELELARISIETAVRLLELLTKLTNPLNCDDQSSPSELGVRVR